MPGFGQQAAQARSTTYGLTYASSFTANQTPIGAQDGALWVNNGLDWSLVNTSGGLAFGTQVGGAFDDSWADLVNVGFGPDIEIIATIFKGATSGIQEVELHFRTFHAAHISRRYEITIAHDGQYCDFVRWPLTGQLGSSNGVNDDQFRYVVPSLTYSVPGGVSNGDLIRGRIRGNVLSCDINHGSGWVAINTAPVVDANGPNGGPQLTAGGAGIGFFKTAGSGAMNQFGFTHVQVTGL